MVVLARTGILGRVHRRRTKLAKRVNRVATAIETRGVRATYGLHDKVLSNRSAAPALLPRASPPSTPPSSASSTSSGWRASPSSLSATSFPIPRAGTESPPKPTAFVTETEEGLRREAAGEGSDLRRSVKTYLVRKNAWGVSLGPDDPWLQLALDPRLLDLANTYIGMWSKLEYVDLWYTPPSDEDERQSSQRWHRDFNDRLLLKAFLYVSDVDDAAGPFEYVPRSFPGGELGDLWPWFPGYDGYPPDEEFARRMEGERIETFTGQRGTLILCNTSGFHRGGYATGRPRVLATWTYSSPASLKALSERNYAPVTDGAATGLAPAARYALR